LDALDTVEWTLAEVFKLFFEPFAGRVYGQATMHSLVKA